MAVKQTPSLLGRLSAGSRALVPWSATGGSSTARSSLAIPETSEPWGLNDPLEPGHLDPFLQNNAGRGHLLFIPRVNWYTAFEIVRTGTILELMHHLTTSGI